MRQYHRNSRTLETSAHFRCCRSVTQHETPALTSPVTVAVLSLGLENSQDGLLRARGPGRHLQGGDQETVAFKAQNPKKAAYKMFEGSRIGLFTVFNFTEVNGHQSILTTHFCLRNRYFPVKNCTIWGIPGQDYLGRFLRKTDTSNINKYYKYKLKK